MASKASVSYTHLDVYKRQIGDNLNDIDMIKHSGVGVAVANAYEELKQIATYTTTNSVENVGFAEAIQKYVIN